MAKKKNESARRTKRPEKGPSGVASMDKMSNRDHMNEAASKEAKSTDPDGKRRRGDDSTKKRKHRDKTMPAASIEKMSNRDPKNEASREGRGTHELDAREKRRRADEIENPTEEQKERFNRFIGDLMATGIDGLIKEYETDLKSYYTPNIQRAGFDKNPDKNRYKDVVCLDQTRVILQGGTNDYIHANFVRGEPLLNTFICTQGPLPNTCADFWRMVVQEKVARIVMLCQTIESKKKKCAQYWPSKVGEQLTFGEFTIRCQEHDMSDRRFVSCSLKVFKGNEQLCSVKHFQWTSWPDRSVPESLLGVFRLLRPARNSRYPTIVHCSAGIGRTGAVVAIEMILQRSVNSEPFKMSSVIKQLRGMRAAAIQTDMQYVYLGISIANYCYEMGIMKPEYANTFLKFKEAYDALSRKRQAEEEAKMHGVADNMACVPPPPSPGVAVPSLPAPIPAVPQPLAPVPAAFPPLLPLASPFILQTPIVPPLPPQIPVVPPFDPMQAVPPPPLSTTPPPMPESAGTGFDIGLPATGNLLGAQTASGTGDNKM